MHSMKFSSRNFLGFTGVTSDLVNKVIYTHDIFADFAPPWFGALRRRIPTELPLRFGLIHTFL